MPAASRSRRAVRQLLVINLLVIIATALIAIHWHVLFIVSTRPREVRDQTTSGRSRHRLPVLNLGGSIVWQTIHEVERDWSIASRAIAALVTGLLSAAALSAYGAAAFLGGLAVAALVLYYLDDVDPFAGLAGLLAVTIFALVVGGLLCIVGVSSGAAAARIACIGGVLAYFTVGGFAVSFGRALREEDDIEEPPHVDVGLRLAASIALAILLACCMAYAQWPSPIWTPVLALLVFFGFFPAARHLHLGAGLGCGIFAGLSGWQALDNAQFGAFIGVLAFFGIGRIMKILLQNLCGRHDSPT